MGDSESHWTSLEEWGDGHQATDFHWKTCVIVQPHIFGGATFPYNGNEH